MLEYHRPTIRICGSTLIVILTQKKAVQFRVVTRGVTFYVPFAFCFVVEHETLFECIIRLALFFTPIIFNSKYMRLKQVSRKRERIHT